MFLNTRLKIVLELVCCAVDIAKRGMVCCAVDIAKRGMVCCAVDIAKRGMVCLCTAK
jgi:hypothetical protein